MTKGLPKISSRAEAENYAFEKLSRLEELRRSCNVIVPGNKEASMVEQKKAFRKYLMALGATLESCSVLHAVGLLDDTKFSDVYDKAMCTMVSDLVGSL